MISVILYMHTGSPSEPLNISLDTSDSSWLTISWNPPLDKGNPYLSHYELGFDDISFSLNNTTHSHIFTGLPKVPHTISHCQLLVSSMAMSLKVCSITSE